MLYKEQSNQPYVKKEYYQILSAKHSPTSKSFEYRMQNISYVRFLMGRSWLKGLKPAKNVGALNIGKIEKMLLQVTGEQQAPSAEFEAAVREAVGKTRLNPPNGTKRPQAVKVEIFSLQRNALVKAWILQNAAGYCECCGARAPFCGADGAPYLEIHHIHHLADGGPDTITNAVALCPNCHREMHYGENADELKAKLLQSLQRLVME